METMNRFSMTLLVMIALAIYAGRSHAQLWGPSGPVPTLGGTPQGPTTHLPISPPTPADTIDVCGVSGTSLCPVHVPIGNGGSSVGGSVPPNWPGYDTPPGNSTPSLANSCSSAYPSKPLISASYNTANCPSQVQCLVTDTNHQPAIYCTGAGNACPSGYSISTDGSTCNLTSQSNAKWPSDGPCTIRRVGNTFSDDPRDPDCTSSHHADLPPPYTRSSDSKTIGGTLNGQTITITIGTDGKTTVTNTVPNNDGKTSQKSTDVFSDPSTQSVPTGSGPTSGAAPIYVGHSEGTANGQGTATDTNPTSPQTDTSSLAKDTTVSQGLNTINQTLSNNSTSVQNSSFQNHEKSFYYTSTYPNGMSGIWSNFQTQLNTSGFVNYLNSYRITASGSAPSWTITVLHGSNMSETSADIGPNIAQLWYWLGIIMMITTLFTCRHIIFGG